MTGGHVSGHYWEESACFPALGVRAFSSTKRILHTHTHTHMHTDFSFGFHVHGRYVYVCAYIEIDRILLYLSHIHTYRDYTYACQHLLRDEKTTTLYLLLCNGRFKIEMEIFLSNVIWQWLVFFFWLPY